MMSETGLGPRLLEVSDAKMMLVFEAVTVGSPQDLIENVEDLEEKIIEVVTMMHEEGWAHGDLHLNNMGRIGQRIYILDNDTMFRIEDGMQEWIQDWINDGYDGQYSFEEFINLDFENPIEEIETWQ